MGGDMARNAIGRRGVLVGGAGLAVASAWPWRATAEEASITLGAVLPLTGNGGVYGPPMARAMQWVIGRINDAGGVLGRKLQLAVEDDETNPDAGVRAARKLIDVDKVPAILGTWASAVTTAVAPLCWENKVFLTTVSGSDTITKLPHMGYLIRTQPTTILQMTKLGAFIASVGAKQVFILGAQAPFVESVHKTLSEVLPQHGVQLVGQVIYDQTKTSFRSEVDEALKAKPDMIFLNGYQGDSTILLKELYRAGYDGKKIGLAYAINQKVLEGLPPEVTEGVYTLAPSPEIDSPAYKRLSQALGIADLDPYTCQVTDHASMVTLAMAQGGAASGLSIHDNIRKVTEPGGTVVDDVVEGLKLLTQGKQVKYTGVSGPCVFTDIGDILDCKFRYEQAAAGKFKLLRIG